MNLKVYLTSQFCNCFSAPNPDLGGPFNRVLASGTFTKKLKTTGKTLKRRKSAS